MNYKCPIKCVDFPLDICRIYWRSTVGMRSFSGRFTGTWHFSVIELTPCYPSGELYHTCSTVWRNNRPSVVVLETGASAACALLLLCIDMWFTIWRTVWQREQTLELKIKSNFICMLPFNIIKMRLKVLHIQEKYNKIRKGINKIKKKVKHPITHAHSNTS